jgi:hypothetical protein
LAGWKVPETTGLTEEEESMTSPLLLLKIASKAPTDQNQSVLFLLLQGAIGRNVFTAVLTSVE